MVGIERCLVRFFSAKNTVVGAGFLAAPGIVLTCEHVVRAALGLLDETPVEASAAVNLDLPFLKSGPLPARVLKADAEKDIAVLRLEADPPPDARPALLVTPQETWGRDFRAYGFPEGHPEGVYADGVLRDHNIRGWLQVEDTHQTGYFVRPGFSGTPVWNSEAGGVVGMVVAVEREPGIRTAWCIPTSQLMEFWPDLGERAVPPNPYRGLLAFREQDAPFFFGREAFADRLVEEVNQYPLMAIVGPSGSGKSSVVFAGLIPRLRMRPGWAITACRPGQEPFAELSASLLLLLEPGMTETDRLREIPKLADGLRTGEIALYRLARRILEKGGHEQLLIIVDQWEELYTLCSEDVRRAFVDMWLQALSLASSFFSLCASAPLHLLLTLRADFMGQALAHRPLADALDGRTLLLGPMNREELARAVVCPAEKQGVRIEGGLVARILDDVRDEPGNLPLLEFALTQLWERQERGWLTYRAYDDIGGVEAALVRYAEELYASLPEAEQETARQIFIQLVRPGEGTEDVRRRAARAELGEARWALVQRLADARLVVTARDPAGQEVVEVAHEALIRRWERLRVWMAEDRDFRLWQERVRAAYRTWEASGRDNGALLRGAPLAQALDWLSRRDDEIESQAREFIRKSQEYAEEEQARWELLYREAEARRLFMVGQSAAGMSTGPLIATILGVESLRMFPTSEGAQLVLRGMGQLPRLVSAIKHNDRVLSVSFSKDGRLIASGSGDGVIRIWETTTGVEIAQMAHKDAVISLLFSPDGKLVISGSWDGTVRVWDIVAKEEIVSMRHNGGVRSVGLSPDGLWIVSGGGDETLRVWEVSTGKEVLCKFHEGQVRSVAFSADGLRIASGSSDQTVRVWDLANGKEIARMKHEGAVQVVTFSPDGKWVISGSWDGTVRVWEIATEREIARVQHEGRVQSVAFSPSGQFVISGSQDKTARVWEVDTGNEVSRMWHSGWVLCVAFSPCGQLAVSGSEDRTARVWKAKTGDELARMLHNGSVQAVSFSPDGQFVLTGSGDRTARVWEKSASQEKIRVEYDGPVRCVAFSPCGSWVAGGSWDHTVRIWEVMTAKELMRFSHIRSVRLVVFSPDGRWVASASEDGTAEVWDVAAKRKVARMSHGKPVRSVAFSPDGERVATGSDDGTARVWEVLTGQEIAKIVHEGPVWSVSFSPDGCFVVSGGYDKTTRVWDIAAGKEVMRKRHYGEVNVVAFSPDGRWVASGSGDGIVEIWEPTTGREVVRVKHRGDVMALAFSPDGRRLVSGSDDYTARVWEIPTGHEVSVMAHDNWVHSVAFSPDGQFVVSGSWDHTLRVWEAKTGRELGRMFHNDGVRSVTFSPDGCFIASGSQDGTIRVWLWRPEDLIAEACRRLPRNLTREEWARYVGPGVPYRPTCPNLPVPGD